MDIRRELTSTPLARQHDALLQARGHRKAIPIPWKEFERSQYPEPALALAYDAQRMLALGEYTAVDLFARLVSGLASVGAPFDLVAAASRIPTDEIRHADYTIRFASLCAGRDVAVEMDPKRMRSLVDPVTLRDLDTFIVEVSAIGETLACALLSACKIGATDPVAKAVYANIVADEVHHARLGWYYLLWRAPQWTVEDRQHVADHAGAMVMDIERRFGTGRDAPRGSRAAARALGVLDTKRQRKTVRDVMVREIVPGLDSLGLGASHAWRARRRIA